MIELATLPSGRPQRLVYLGTPEMAVAPLEALVANGFDVALVITRGDKRRGRGNGLTPSPVKAAALRLGLPVSHAVDDALHQHAELGVVVAFGQLIKRDVLERLPMVNLHFSLLPRWRGAAPVERALLAGDTLTGVCLMQLGEGLDTGAILDVVEVPIGSGETAADLRAVLVDVGAHQLVRVLSTGLGAPVAQQGEASYAAKLRPEEFAIDWHRTAEQIHRLVRLGVAFTTFRGKRLKVLGARVDTAPASPARYAEHLRVGCGVASLVLERVQPEGKPAMDAAAWVHGSHPEEGEQFGESVSG